MTNKWGYTHNELKEPEVKLSSRSRLWYFVIGISLAALVVMKGVING